MHNACIGGLGNTSSLPIVMINVVFENTLFWALGVYGRILKAPIPQYTAVYSGVYGRILRVYGRILRVYGRILGVYTAVYSKYTAKDLC